MMTLRSAQFVRFIGHHHHRCDARVPVRRAVGWQRLTCGRAGGARGELALWSRLSGGFHGGGARADARHMWRSLTAVGTTSRRSFGASPVDDSERGSRHDQIQVEKSTRLVKMALGGNLFISAAKFAVWQNSGSSAMLAEAIHSLVDSGNQVRTAHSSARHPQHLTRPRYRRCC